MDWSPSAAQLSACDREPIHLPGTIQPHGFLLSLNPEKWTVERASENVATYLGLDLRQILGQPVAHVIGGSSTALLRQASADPLFTQRAIFIDRLRIKATGHTFALVAHRHRGSIIVECELLPPDPGASLPDTNYQLETFLARMEVAPTAQALLQMAAEETRRITGFDRVLIYQFDSDWNGIVVAEDRNDVLPSYLDPRFPSSDIPRQAREL